MSKLKITDANIIHAAFIIHRDGDVAEMKRLDAEIIQCKEDIDALAHSILEGDQWLKRGAVGGCTNISLARKGHSKSYTYFLVWNSGDHKDYKLCTISGHSRLKGNPRKRAIRAFKKLGRLLSQRRKAWQRTQDWQSRKRNLVSRRIKDRPDILAKMRALCEEAMISPEKDGSGKKRKKISG